MTKSLFRVICVDADGARSRSNPEQGLQEDVLYEVVADVADARTARVPEGGSSGYVVRNADTGVVLAQIYNRDRFVRENANADGDQPIQVLADPAIEVGDTVICVDAVGARSFSKPETMLQQDKAYIVTADVEDAVTARKPEGGASGFMVKSANEGTYLAGVFRRSRFQIA